MQHRRKSVLAIILLEDTREAPKIITNTGAKFGELSGTGDSQRDSRESIRANHSHSKPLFL